MKFPGSNIHGFSQASRNKAMLWMCFTFAPAAVHFPHNQGFQTAARCPQRHALNRTQMHQMC